MRREIRLFSELPLWDNLGLALLKTLRGKRGRGEAQSFLSAMPGSLERIASRLRTGQGPEGRFREFIIHDPKKRLISAPCFADRVLHHAVMNVCEPVFERWLISQTYACRTGLGLRAAIRESQKWVNRKAWYLQMDVKHYFETVPREPLLRKLERLFGEPELLGLWASIIHSHRPGERRGMPIGALTSQHLANFYLGFLDRFIKEELRIRGYARYMDDLVLWHEDKDMLLRAREEIIGFATGRLGLRMKPAILNRAAGGMDFLGFRFQPGWIGLSRRSRRRFRQRIRGYERAWAEGRLSERELQDRATAAFAFIAPAKAGRVRRQLVDGSLYDVDA